MKQHVMRDIGILFIVTLCACFFMFKDGFPIGYDYKNLFIAYEAVSTQIQDGEIYPRWLSDVNRGFGSANLFFYPPLTYYTAFLIDAITGFAFETNSIMIANVALLLFLSGVSFYIFAKSHTNTLYAVIGASVYMLLPYHSWFEIYERNAIAELSAYIWIPLLFYYLRPDKKPDAFNMAKLSAVYALLIISHLPAAVFVSLFLGIYIVRNASNCASSTAWISYATDNGLALFTGLLVSCFYLYPALSLLSETNSAYLWDGFYDYRQWFLWFKTSCPIQDACDHLLQISLMQIVLLSVLASIVLFSDKQRENRSDLKGFFGLALFCFFMMTPLSALLWSAVSPLQKIQFPWRLLTVLDFFSAACITLSLFALHNRSPKTALTLCLITVIPLGIQTTRTAHYAQLSWAPPKEKFEDSIAKKMLTEEHIPFSKVRSLSYKEMQEAEDYPEFSIVTGDAEITTERMNARHIIVNVNAHSSTIINYRQFYFNGWHVYENGKDISSDVNLTEAEPYGQLQMTLPAGEYTLELKLDTLPQERTGKLLSFIGLTLLIVSLLGFKCRCRCANKKREA